MPRNPIHIDQMAELSRLHLNSKEKAKLSADLEKIVAYVKQLQELNVDGTAPTSHVLPLENVFRADEVKQSEAAQHILNHAPKREGGFFKVPKVIEEY